MSKATNKNDYVSKNGIKTLFNFLDPIFSDYTTMLIIVHSHKTFGFNEERKFCLVTLQTASLCLISEHFNYIEED